MHNRLIGPTLFNGMTIDITGILRDWPYEPGQINVRLIEGDDGEPKIQMRLDLGLLQMETSGRPDGQRPQGYESLLEYYEAALDEHVTQAEGEDADPFVLAGDDCRQLREEAVQYYHRYISLLVLGDFQGVVRDTTRNLRVLDFCRDHAEAEEDRDILEQFRPYISMMRARAIASQAIADNEPNAAVFAIDEGLEAVKKIYSEGGDAEAFEAANEVLLLRGMRDELVKKLPASQKTELRRRLQEAIEHENYELAAILRDELRMLKE